MHSLSNSELSAKHNRTVSGWQLRHGTALAKVLDAHAACNGGLVVCGLSNRQAERLTGVRRTLISIVNKAGPETVEALEEGYISLSDLRVAAERKSKSERVSRYVRRVGVPAVLDAIGQLPGSRTYLPGLLLDAFGNGIASDLLERATAPAAITTD
jgi:hypothetical protein